MNVRNSRTAACALATLMAATSLLGGCSAGNVPAPAATQSADTMTMAEMRLNEAGGPAEAAIPADVVSPAAALSALEQPSPLGRDWLFTQVDGFDGPLPSPPPVAGFIMTREGRRLTGTTACNRMGSAYELDPSVGRLRFVDLRNTRMLCDRIAADTEEAVLEAMIITDAYRIVDGQLELLSKGRVVARLISP